MAILMNCQYITLCRLRKPTSGLRHAVGLLRRTEGGDGRIRTPDALLEHATFREWCIQPALPRLLNLLLYH